MKRRTRSGRIKNSATETLRHGGKGEYDRIAHIPKKARSPLVAIVAYDTEFYHKLDKLMPYRVIKPWTPATRPMLAGLDKIDQEFFAGTSWRSNFLCALGYGARSQLHPRLPRLDFAEAVKTLQS